MTRTELDRLLQMEIQSPWETMYDVKNARFQQFLMVCFWPYVIVIK